MYKTYEVMTDRIDGRDTGTRKLKAYEDYQRVMYITLDKSDVDVACKVLDALGYRQTYRAY